MSAFNLSKSIPKFSSQESKRAFVGLLILGFILRFSLLLSSPNFDFESYKITSELILAGDPPWRGQRYNYGITWSLVLGVLNFCSFGNDLVFRFSIVAILSMADLSITLNLRKWFGTKVACIFFLNPISILVSGHYNQFDNLSIAIGLWGLVFLNKYKKTKNINDLTKCVLLFALSLTVKHNLALFLIWFLFSNFNKREKSALIVIPSFIFLVHFVPFMLISKFDRENIMSAVFKYWSSNNAPFWKFWFWDKDFAEGLGNHHAWHHGRLWMILMVLAVASTGLIVSKLSFQKQFAVYTVSLIVFASAITSQFLAIAAIGASVFFNWGFMLYFITISLYLAAEFAGLNLTVLQPFLYHRGWNAWNIGPTLLILGFLVGASKRIFKRKLRFRI
jgi:hypothetical protein